MSLPAVVLHWIVDRQIRRVAHHADRGLLFIGHILMTLTGTGFGSFARALALPGVGWNFMYIGGTTLLTSTYTPAEKARAQAINNMAIFAAGLACSFCAGGLLECVQGIQINGGASCQ